MSAVSLPRIWSLVSLQEGNYDVAEFAPSNRRILGASVGLTLDGKRENREARDVSGRAHSQYS
jgi:hypothetical protein